MMTREEIERVFRMAFAAAKENIDVKRWQWNSQNCGRMNS